MMEMIAVIYVYGHKKFTNDIFEMTGIKPGIYWQITWRYLAPVIMLVILTSSIVSMSINHPTYQAWSKEEVRSLIWYNNNVVSEPESRSPHSYVFLGAGNKEGNNKKLLKPFFVHFREMSSTRHIPLGFSP